MFPCARCNIAMVRALRSAPLTVEVKVGIYNLRAHGETSATVHVLNSFYHWKSSTENDIFHTSPVLCSLIKLEPYLKH